MIVVDPCSVALTPVVAVESVEDVVAVETVASVVAVASVVDVVAVDRGRCPLFHFTCGLSLR